MKKNHLVAITVLVAAGAVSAITMINGRACPDNTDWTNAGNQSAYNAMVSILQDVAATIDDSGTVTLDSIRGNPDIDSLSGKPFIDTVTTRAIKVGRATIYIAKIDTITNADTLVIVLNTGDSLIIGKDR